MNEEDRAFLAEAEQRFNQLRERMRTFHNTVGNIARKTPMPPLYEREDRNDVLKRNIGVRTLWTNVYREHGRSIFTAEYARFTEMPQDSATQGGVEELDSPSLEGTHGETRERAQIATLIFEMPHSLDEADASRLVRVKTYHETDTGYFGWRADRVVREADGKFAYIEVPPELFYPCVDRAEELIAQFSTQQQSE